MGRKPEGPVYSKIRKWDRWLQTIHDDLKDEAACRMVYLETIAIVDSNENIAKDSDFFDCLERWYVNSAVMGLRRRLKIHPSAISLAGLLKDMAANACLLSRDHVASQYADQT